MKEHLLSISEIGATRRALTKEMLENLEISIPDISEQKSIAEILSSLDDKIDVGSVPGRMIILAGLILLEEFARRNFNIISRLAESYAYKEVLAKSYLGYKEQMEEIMMPSFDGKTSNKCVSELVKIFLSKLDDEPGKDVFDKEKHVAGPGALIEQSSPSNKEGLAGKALEEISKGSIISKISWPIVAVITILAGATCFIVYLLR